MMPKFMLRAQLVILALLCAPLGQAALDADKETTATPAAQTKGDIDLGALKEKYQNAIVKIEFTAVSNKDDIKLNPTKSEIYYASSEAPHGSGFFISESEILTNAHVVELARKGSIRVKSPATGNVEFKAEVAGLGESETIDLALLRLPSDELVRFRKRSGIDAVPKLDFADSDQVKQADPVAVFGYPQSSDELKIIQGKVTGRQYLKIAADRFVCGHQFIEVGPGGVIQPGNSGGPALDRHGRVIGIPARGSGYGSEQGWLIPSAIVTHFLDRLKSNDCGRKCMELPKLGIRLAENFAGTAVWAGAPQDCVLFELGALVREVTSNSLAAMWGIREGDMLVGYANKQKHFSCALDFTGYRVITGKMKCWPPEIAATSTSAAGDAAKLHLHEMVLLGDPGDDITLWYVRRGTPGIQKIDAKLEYREPVKKAHLGPFEKPDFELWGDFVAQDFNDYNTALFEVPDREIQHGGVLVTAVEPNSLASRRGMNLNHRSWMGFSWSSQDEPSTSWVIIETVNGKPVKDLKELKTSLREAEKQYEQKQKEPGFDPATRTCMKQRYVEIGFRTNTNAGNVLHLKPAFPIDEALECKEAAKVHLD